MTTCRSRSLGVSPLLLGLVLCLGLVVCLSAVPTWGQAVATGTVTGTVLDPQNAAVAGATVTLTDKSGGEPRTTTTTDTGRFVFTQIAPGNYDLNVSKTGFATAKVVNQTVSIGQELRLDVNLKVGAASETVEVTATVGAELQTMNSSVGQTIKGDQLLYLPNFGRDASSLATLQPATNPTGEVAGAALDQNSFQLDGANNSNDMDGSMQIYTPSYASNGAPTGVMPTPVESIEEFKVNTNNQTADFNASAGGQVMMATKKGTNSWHGGLWEYYTDAAFGGANTWSNNRLGRPITDNHQNRFGGNVGGAILPKFLGGKTYLFTEYDGRRFPNAGQVEFSVPTAALRSGIVQIDNGNGTTVPVNISGHTVAFNGQNIAPSNFCGPAGNLPCDPRSLGLNPIVSQLWSKFEPLPNDPAGGDQFNTQGFISNISLPQTDNGYIARLDHDFGDKWHAMVSYHWYHLKRATTNMVDIGGFFSGDTLGQATSLSNRPQVPSLIVGGLTTNVSSNVTNDIHFSYLRNFWQWLDPGLSPQAAGINNVLELGGESSRDVEQPFNVDNQDTRTRFWDGQDKMIRDDVSWLRGNHLFQFGGLYQRNYLQHRRNDNGGTIQASPFPVAISATASTDALDLTNATPANCGGAITTNCVPAGVDTTNYQRYYAEALGIITQTQELFVRKGTNLALQPNGSFALEQSIVPTYNMYFTDTWRMKPTFTLTYGLGYQIEMPPFEINGSQTMLVDDADNPITIQQYLSRTFTAAQQGNIYNPVLGFATVRNVAGNEHSAPGVKYPYNPFYKGFSPRVSFAWNPNFDQGIMGHMFGHGKTVIRGGYGRVYGRLNGVDLILVPLLAPGLLQATTCQGPQINGTCGSATASTAFRIGTDGKTAPLGPAPSTNLPQPFFPGVNGQPSAGAGEALDPNFRPNQSDEFDLTIQRQVTNRMIVELGYIGRRIRNEYQAIDTAAVPYMLVEGGQTFENAWANLYQQVNAGATVTAQPFFETSLGGSTSAYCTGFSSCTAAVASREKANIKGTRSPAVYDLWQDLSTPTTMNPNGAFIFGRSMPSSPNCQNSVIQLVNPTAPVPVCQQFNAIGLNGSLGYGNYNAAFVSVTSTNWHGLTARSNFTYGRALGTQSVVQATSEFTVDDPWNLHNGYGPQPFDFRFVYNLSAVYQPEIFKGHGWKHSVLGGWSIAPLFTARSGGPLEVNIFEGAGEDCQAFGESDCNFFANDEGAVFVSAAGIANARGNGNGPAVNHVTISGTVGSLSNTLHLNLFANPAAVFAGFRAPILGIDTNPGSFALRGLPAWNLDMTLAKDFAVTERFGVQFIVQASNVLNHMIFNDPAGTSLDINQPTRFGRLTSQNNSPRSMEFGLRFHF